MRLTLNPIETACYKLVYQNQLSSEASNELVIPDVSKDASCILDVRGQVLANTKSVSADKINLSATVRTTIIYTAEEDEKQECVRAEIPFEFDIPAGGATENSYVTVSYELCHVEAKLLNSRKLLLTAHLKCRVCCFEPGEFVVWSKPQSSAGCEIHTLTKEVRHFLTTGLREKTFSVSDEYSLPSGKPEDSTLLGATTEICVLDAKAVGNKLVFKATAKTTAVFRGGDELFQCEFDSPFSQIIEFDGDGEGIEATLLTVIKEAEFTRLPDRDTACYAASFSVCAQAVCCRPITTCYICDAYSNEYELKPQFSQTELKTYNGAKTIKTELRGTLMSGVEASQLQYLAPVGACTSVEEENIQISACVNAVYCNENGQLKSTLVTMKGIEQLDLCAGQELSIVSVCAESPECTRGGEIILQLCIETKISKAETINVISALEYDEENPSNCNIRPSLRVLCSPAQMEVWVLAKKYGSTVALIEEANTIDGVFDLNARPLLIPRA